jgi:hypothetical protein
MLKTNGSSASRDTYSNSVGSIVIVPARAFANRTPFGLCEFSITCRFAGVHSPGLGVPKELQSAEEKQYKDQITTLQEQISNLIAMINP